MYKVVRGEVLDIEAVFVDRTHQMLWLIFDDASLHIIPIIARPKKTWPSGCPSNIQSTRMETWDLDIEQLHLTSESISHPILVRDCPTKPVELVLRADGEIDGTGTACVGAHTCLVFEWASSTLSLPHSMKGYELYSWYVAEDDAWYYTLTTGTNRSKTWEEISTSESTRTASDWVKITVQGEDALKSILGRLPEGEMCWWIGPQAPQAASGLAPHIELPDASIIREIQTYGQQSSINLDVDQ
jgi:hypothetical protein